MQEAANRLQRYGKNEMAMEQQFSIVKLIVSQFKSPMIYILVMAMGVTLALGHKVDAIVIGMAVVLNTMLGFWQEFKAEKSLEKLAAVLTQSVKVMRDGERMTVELTNLVPGDVVFLEAGDKVPADGILINAQELQVSEAVLTGESLPISKKSWEIKKEKLGRQGQDWFGKLFTSLEKRKNEGEKSVYAGSLVRRGNGVMVVVKTGRSTEVGKIAKAIATTEREATPLQKQLAVLSHKLALIVGMLAVGLLVVGMVKGMSWIEVFTLAVAVAVSSIPEGLVVSLTAILAIGMQRILKRKALVRKLVAAEVLGSVSVICTDKTGTITEGVLRVREVEIMNKQLGQAALISTSDRQDPMEVAMHEWVENELTEAEIEQFKIKYERLDRWPFQSERKFSATLTKIDLFVVGAPEMILERVRLSKAEKAEWQAKINKQAKKGMRLVGVAHRKRGEARKISKSLLDKPLYWLGYVVYEDKVRKGIKEVYEETKKAGIKTIVITGDYRETALEVMRQLGMKVVKTEVIEGEELGQMSDQELDKRIERVKLFARTSPEQKLKIVGSLQRMGEVVAMTGDGVNDAPALKKADIGIVVSGASEVAKETADIVLLDDNFETILAAAEEGRGIFANLKKVVVYLLSDSFSEMVAILGAIFLGLPVPLLPAQILWINLVNDGLPNLALTVDPKDEDLLDHPPRSPKTSILDREIIFFIGLISVVTGIFTLGSFIWLYKIQGASLMYARTFAFALSCLDSLLYVFSLRSLKVPMWEYKTHNSWLMMAVVGGVVLQLAAIYVPFMQRILGTVPLTSDDWLRVVGLSVVVITIIESVKWWRSRFGKLSG